MAAGCRGFKFTTLVGGWAEWQDTKWQVLRFYLELRTVWIGMGIEGVGRAKSSYEVRRDWTREPGRGTLVAKKIGKCGKQNRASWIIWSHNSSLFRGSLISTSTLSPVPSSAHQPCHGHGEEHSCMSASSPTLPPCPGFNKLADTLFLCPEPHLHPCPGNWIFLVLPCRIILPFLLWDLQNQFPVSPHSILFLLPPWNPPSTSCYTTITQHCFAKRLPLLPGFPDQLSDSSHLTHPTLLSISDFQVVDSLRYIHATLLQLRVPMFYRKGWHDRYLSKAQWI